MRNLSVFVSIRCLYSYLFGRRFCSVLRPSSGCLRLHRRSHHSRSRLRSRCPSRSFRSHFHLFCPCLERRIFVVRGISSARDSSVLGEGEQERAKGSRGEQMEGVRNERRHEISARVLDDLIKGRTGCLTNSYGVTCRPLNPLSEIDRKSKKFRRGLGGLAEAARL